ncbi:MAG: hypothetical protein INR64_02490 [Caulobacteraceae bacterium]|nr:hypothetical protein [Caulobacter sp.]
MSDGGPEQIAVAPVRRHRWLRRELWFVLAAILLIAAVVVGYRHSPPTHVAPGQPIGGVPTGPVAPAPRPVPTQGA